MLLSVTSEWYMYVTVMCTDKELLCIICPHEDKHLSVEFSDPCGDAGSRSFDGNLSMWQVRYDQVCQLANLANYLEIRLFHQFGQEPLVPQTLSQRVL